MDVGQLVTVPVRLFREGAVTVTVVGPDGPVPNAEVTLQHGLVVNQVRSGATNSVGQIVFAGGDSVSEGPFSVKARDPATGIRGSIGGSVPDIYTSPNGRVAVTVTLDNALGTVQGRFLRTGGQAAIPNAQVVLRGAGRELYGATDAQGAWSFQGIPLGSFTVDAFDPLTARHGHGSGTLSLAQRDVTLDLVEQPVGAVTGFVRRSPGNTPVTGAEVTLKVFGVTNATYQTTSGVNGSYRFPAVPAGQFTLEAVEPATGLKARASGAVASEGETVAVDLQIVQPALGRVLGTVRQADGRPAIVGTVRLLTAGVDRTTTLDNTGHYTFEVVPLGDVTVDARAGDGNTGATGAGRLAFDGDTAVIDLQFVGTGRILGTVLTGAGQPVALANVAVARKERLPLAVNRTAQADASGRFTVTNLLLGTYSVTGQQAVTRLGGAASGVLSSTGSTLVLTITLEPAGTVTGQVLREDGVTPAAGMALELTKPDAARYGASAVDGAFTFADLPLGTYQLTVSDPLGQGIARAAATLSAQGQSVSVGALRLDAVPPAVVAITPTNQTAGVPVSAPIVVTFSEPVQPDTINRANLPVVAGGLPVSGTWVLSADRTQATFTAAQPYRDFTTVAVQVRTGVADDVGRALAGEAFAAFVTTDTTPPSILSRSPAPGEGNVAPATPVRVAYSTAVDPARFAGAPVWVLLAGQPVSGQVSFILNNTVLVFMPLVPWPPNATVTVTLAAATDLFGNRQPSGESYTFATLDSVPPVLQALTAPSGTVVLAGTTARVVAVLPVVGDVDSVEFAVGGQVRLVDTAAPFEYVLPVPAGATTPVTVTARATDRAGNYSLPQNLVLTVSVDRPPLVAIQAPVSGTAVGSGSHVAVTVAFADDNGVTQVYFQALGAAQANASIPLGAQPVAGTTQFSVDVPAAAAPGSRVELRASALDTQNQAAATISSTLLVTDATPPSLYLTAPPLNAQVTPGELLPVIATVLDNGPIASVRLQAGGAAAFEQTLPCDQVTGSCAAPYTAVFTVPVAASARPPQTLQLTVTAADAAGNLSVPYQRTLPVRDQQTPTVTVAVLDSAAVPGLRLGLIVTGTDDVGVTRLGYRLEGALTGQGAQIVSPVPGRTSATFSFTVPVTVTAGSLLVIAGTGDDAAGNRGESTPVTIPVGADARPVVRFLTVGGCQLSDPACVPQAVNGAALTATVTATDTEGVSSIRLQAAGALSALQVYSLTPAAAVTHAFTLDVPLSTAPGQPLLLIAEAVDTRGQVAGTEPVTVLVSDRTPPVVQLQAPPNGSAMTPGLPFTVTVTASDNVLVSAVRLAASGALSVTTAAGITPAAAVATSFVLTVPASAAATDPLTITIEATDAAGNRSLPGVLSLQIRDVRGPAVTLSLGSGSTALLPGREVSFTVTATDEVAVVLLVLSPTAPLR